MEVKNILFFTLIISFPSPNEGSRHQTVIHIKNELLSESKVAKCVLFVLLSTRLGPLLSVHVYSIDVLTVEWVLSTSGRPPDVRIVLSSPK